LEILPELIRELQPVVAGILTQLAVHGHELHRDWVSRNALYCALRCSLSLPQNLQARYRLLQAHFFFAHTAILLRNARRAVAATSVTDYEAYGRVEEWPALGVAPYHAGLCIRDMAKQKHSQWAVEFLESLPVTLTPRELPARSTVTMTSRMKGFSVEKKVNYVSDYLRQAYGIKPRGHGHGSSPGRLLWHSAIGDPEDPALNFGTLSDWKTDAHPGTVNSLVLSPLSAEMAKTDSETLEDQDVDTDEYEDQGEDENFGGSLDCGDSRYESSPGSFQGRIAGTVNQLVREQKMFRFGIERLSGRELVGLGRSSVIRIYALLDGADWHDEDVVYRRARCPGLNTREGAEALLFLMLMLWTGSSAARVANLIVIRGKNIPDGVPFAVIGAAWSRQAMIRTSVPFPVYTRAQLANPDFDCLRTEYVLLPDLIGIKVAIDSLAQSYGLRGDYIRLFQKPPDEYMKNARSILKSWDPSGRLTLNKISSTLFARVMSASGNDMVAATMITGNKHHLSDVPMYYACRQMSAIQKIYARAVFQLRDEITTAETGAKMTTSAWQAPVDDSDGEDKDLQTENERINALYIGRRLCPRNEKVRESVRALKNDLRKPYKSSPDQAWITFSNLYTFYTLWVFGMATGVRKMVTPYIDVSEVSPLNGVARIRDKDGDAGTKAKLVWIPGMVVEQMKHFAAHRAYIRSRFQIADGGLPCFFLSDQGRTKLARPATMFPYLEKYLPGFPVDIHRRFIFNALLNSGCPPEVGRIWMGHACAGEEWWSDNATFSHQDYRGKLRQYLVPILNYLAFEPVGGAVPADEEEIVTNA
jgi:hypothetical protein